MKWVAYYATQRFELEADTLEEAAGKAFEEFKPITSDLSRFVDLENNERHYIYESDGHEMNLIDEYAQDREVRVTMVVKVPSDEDDIKSFISRRGVALGGKIESFEVLPNV